MMTHETNRILLGFEILNSLINEDAGIFGPVRAHESARAQTTVSKIKR
jgi:hypothetical protein